MTSSEELLEQLRKALPEGVDDELPRLRVSRRAEEHTLMLDHAVRGQFRLGRLVAGRLELELPASVELPARLAALGLLGAGAVIPSELLDDPLELRALLLELHRALARRTAPPPLRPSS